MWLGTHDADMPSKRTWSDMNFRWFLLCCRSRSLSTGVRPSASSMLYHAVQDLLDALQHVEGAALSRISVMVACLCSTCHSSAVTPD